MTKTGVTLNSHLIRFEKKKKKGLRSSKLNSNKIRTKLRVRGKFSRMIKPHQPIKELESFGRIKDTFVLTFVVYRWYEYVL